MKTGSKKAAKAPRRPGGETMKVNLTLGAEQYKRLFVTSVMSGETASAIVDALVAEHLREWSMPGNLAGRGKITDRATEAVQASPDGQIAA